MPFVVNGGCRSKTKTKPVCLYSEQFEGPADVEVQHATVCFLAERQEVSLEPLSAASLRCFMSGPPTADGRAVVTSLHAQGCPEPSGPAGSVWSGLVLNSVVEGGCDAAHCRRNLRNISLVG